VKSPLPRPITAVTVAILVIAAVWLVYQQAVFAYFLDDDFDWFATARRFEWANLIRLDQYNHFYRPIVAIYFFFGQRILGCTAFPFHLASLCLHLLNTTVLFLFAWRLANSVLFALLTVVLFVVQPGYVEAVAWVAAITDLLPAFWYLMTLLLHLLFLRTRRWWAYVSAMATFVACLLTHESAATLLPMMIALEILLVLENRSERGGVNPAAWLARYAPFALMLVLFLIVAYVVNSRNYVVQEGYYAFGPHAFRNAIHYVVALYVGKRTLIDYLLIAGAIAAVMLRGTLRTRFFVVWMFVTMLPVLFFTWGIASRYMYLPAAGFALLLADVLIASERLTARWVSSPAARTVTGVVALALAARFAVFAEKGAHDFRERTQPYVRLAGAIAASNATLPSDRIVYVDRKIADAIPTLYLHHAAETVFCTGDVQVVPR
jgi:hypothetical protein